MLSKTTKLIIVLSLVLSVIASVAEAGRRWCNRCRSNSCGCYDNYYHGYNNRVFVPWNYGHANVLLELPHDYAYSRVAVPLGSYAPLAYIPSPAGEGLKQPATQVVERIIERVQEIPAEREYVKKEYVYREPAREYIEKSCSPGEKLQQEAQKLCDEGLPLTGLAVAQQRCASCHTGQEAKAAKRPAFFDDKGKFTATAAQREKMLEAARFGTMPPPKKGEPLNESEFYIFSDWLEKLNTDRPKEETKKPEKEPVKETGYSTGYGFIGDVNPNVLSFGVIVGLLVSAYSMRRERKNNAH